MALAFLRLFFFFCFVFRLPFLCERGPQLLRLSLKIKLLKLIEVGDLQYVSFRSYEFLRENYLFSREKETYRVKS